MSSIAEIGKRCSGCSGCEQACAVGAIRFDADAEGFMQPVVDADKCIDCGKSVYVSIFDSKTVRCEDCQSKVDNQLNKERQKRWYDNHIKPNGSL